MAQEGNLRIKLHDQNTDTYIVLFAPNQEEWLTRPYEKIQGLDGIRKHLRVRKIDEHIIEIALKELQQTAVCDIPYVSSDC